VRACWLSVGDVAARDAGEAAAAATTASARLLPAGAASGWRRAMSTSKGRSMRSKVEKRMARETGRTQRELRRAVKLRKKLMTDDEKLIYQLRRVPTHHKPHSSLSRP
jgi:hypothetical protein